MDKKWHMEVHMEEMSMNTSSISFKKASLGYGKKAVVKDLHLDIRGGEFFSLLGKSGSGKSTVIKTIAGLLPLLSGTLKFNGLPADRLPPEERNAPLLFQDLRLFPHMNVQDNMAFGLKMRGVGKEERYEAVATMLEKLGLPSYAKRRINELSGGEQQRIALARAVLTRPQILLLDEPFSSLDLELKQDMRTLVRNMHREYGFTCVFVTHDLGEALSLSDRLAIMDKGKLLFSGECRQIFEDSSAESYIRPWLKEVELWKGYF